MTDSNVIEGQFCLCDFTMVKVMLPAMVVGGTRRAGADAHGRGPLSRQERQHARHEYLGAAIFGAALVFYGLCPGTGLAAVGTDSLHALAGVFGMIAGAILYAFSCAWIKAHILDVWALGKVRLPELTGIPDLAWFAVVGAAGVAAFVWIERRSGAN